MIQAAACTQPSAIPPSSLHWSSAPHHPCIGAQHLPLQLPSPYLHLMSSAHAHVADSLLSVSPCCPMQAVGTRNHEQQSVTGHAHAHRCWASALSGIPPREPLFNGSICRPASLALFQSAFSRSRNIAASVEVRNCNSDGTGSLDCKMHVQISVVMNIVMRSTRF